MSVGFHVVIPARYASSRLPAKPLLDIGGKPMVIRVIEQALKSGAQTVTVATDHAAIFQTVQEQGYAVCMTSEHHPSGTDRIAEVAQQLGWSEDEIVVNVQGDEPLISPTLIQEVAQQLANSPQASMSTAAHAIHDKVTMMNPNVVKVVLNHLQHAMYFSRAPIPYPRDAFSKQAEIPTDVFVYRHIGIYAYRASFLHQFKSLETTTLEQTESLEQLRVLWHGYQISVALTAHAPATGVDTEQDLIQVRQIFKALDR